MCVRQRNCGESNVKDAMMRHENVKIRDALVERGILRCDDLGDLRVYTYVDHHKDWDETTINSRGIVLNRETGEVVAHPFPKFFNMGQRVETQERNLPWHDGFRIFVKEDGWLGTLYRHNGKYGIATRGSFKSPGAVWATKFLENYNLSMLPDEITLVFEIVSPQTRIIVDYGDREDLVLLAAYNRHTGEELDWDYVTEISRCFGFTLVESMGQEWLGSCRGHLKTASGTKMEGFVIRFDNGLRVKLKGDDYLRRAHILARLTPLTVWDNMEFGVVDPMLWEVLDVDYHDRLREMASALRREYERVRTEIVSQFDQIADETDPAEFAKKAQRMSHGHAMFAMRDGMDNRIENYIMKSIRPKNNVIGHEKG